MSAYINDIQLQYVIILSTVYIYKVMTGVLHSKNIYRVAIQYVIQDRSVGSVGRYVLASEV